MTNSKRRTLGTVALALGLVALTLILILTALHAVGTDGKLYYKLQQAAWETMDAASAAGIGDADLRDLDGRLAAYLAGDENALNEGETVVQIAVRGKIQPAFNAKEMTHMADCYRLFQLLRKVRARLAELKEQQRQEQMGEIKGELKKIEWGSQIRSYVFQHYTMVKDHRTGYEMGDVNAVMDGKLEGFVTSYLQKL